VDSKFMNRMSDLWEQLTSGEASRRTEEYIVIGRMRTALWPDLVGDLSILTNGYYG